MAPLLLETVVLLTITCTDPTSSVLYDGHIPTLTGLDGDMWASQLLTLHTTTRRTDITFDFSTTPDFREVRRVEVSLCMLVNTQLSLCPWSTT